MIDINFNISMFLLEVFNKCPSVKKHVNNRVCRVWIKHLTYFFKTKNILQEKNPIVSAQKGIQLGVSECNYI